MIRTARCVRAAALLLSLASAGGADVVILRNGDRITGEIVEETPAEVSIRRVFKGGKIRYIDKIKRADIVRVEKTDDATPTSPPSTSTPTPATRPDQAASTQPSLSASERQEILATALDRWKKKDYAGTGVNLSRLINNSAHEQLPDLSAEVERKLDMSLADLAAEAHLRAAIEKSKSHGFRLQFVTEYEKPSLIPRLIDTYKDALTQKSRVEPSRNRDLHHTTRSKTPRDRHSDTQPADHLDKQNTRAPQQQDIGGSGRAYAIADYLDKPKEFDGDKEDAHAFTGQIRFAMGLLAERMRFDPQVRQNRTLRTELTEEKRRLLALHKAVLARAGGAMTPQERQARQDESRQQQEQLLKAMEQEQRRQQSHVRKALRMAQEHERQKQENPPE